MPPRFRCALVRRFAAAAAAGILVSPWVGAQERPEPVVFVAYNLKNYLDMDRRVGGEFVEDAPKPEAEIAAAVTLLDVLQPDILGVCEIGDRNDVADLQRRLEDSGTDLPHTLWVDGPDAERRLALLSRFPIVSDNSQTDLSYRIDTQQLPFQRGILDATVEVDTDYRLRVVGVHLKSKREVPEADQALMRRNEAWLLRRHLDGILAESPDANLLVYGDFNDTRNEPAVREIQGGFGTPRYLRDLQLADPDGARWTYYWSFADIYSRIDFILVSAGLYPEVDLEKSMVLKHPAWSQASDHRPIAAAIIPAEKR